MGKVLDTISGQVTAPGTTYTAWTVASGDSLAVRFHDPAKPASLIAMWAKNQTAGNFRVHSPKLHDNTKGIHFSVLAADVEPMLPHSVGQRLYPQDTLIVEQTGSPTAGQFEQGSLLVYYPDLGSSDARLIDLPTLQKRGVELVSVEIDLTPGSAGGYSGAAALNATEDLLKGNTLYALVGYVVSARCTTVAFKGPDTSNFRVSGPGETTKRDLTSRWFLFLAQQTGLEVIPVFNSANKASTFVDVVQDQVGTATNVHASLVELSPA